MSRKGIILAGGSGTRLHPLTMVTSKQLLPVYHLPMIYYPLATLVEMKIREVLIITTPEHLSTFAKVLGDGSQWGMSIEYAIQEVPNGIAHAYTIGRTFLGNDPSVLILGDNLYAKNMSGFDSYNTTRATVVCRAVSDPHRFGVAEFDDIGSGRVISIEEKPLRPKSPMAVTGLYFYDNTAVDRVKELVPSARGELEITDLNNSYIRDKMLSARIYGPQEFWSDMGTVHSYHQAIDFIAKAQPIGGRIGSVDRAALRNEWIDEDQLYRHAQTYGKTDYAEYLKTISNKGDVKNVIAHHPV